MKIRTQMSVGMVVFAILIIIIGSLVVTTNFEAEKLLRQEKIANDIALQVGELGYLSDDYILYREPQQLERWETKYSSIQDLLASLSVENPEQKVIAGNLAANLRSTKAVFDDVRSSPPPDSGSSPIGFIQLSWSRMAIQNQGMIFDAGRLASLLRDQAEGMKQARTLLILALSGAFVAFLFTSYTLFFRRTLNSIADLQEGARIVGSGNLGHTIEEKGDDEITDLTRSFNKMSSDLRTVTASKADLEREMVGRKKAEEDLVRANASLRRSEENLVGQNLRLNALNEELHVAQEELQQNVNELTRAQHELRRLAAFPEQNPSPVIEVDAAGNLTYLNPAASLLFPDLRDRGMDHPYLEGLDPVFGQGSTPDTPTPPFARDIEVGILTFEQTITRDREIGRFRIYGRDITGRKNAEHQIRESEERVRLAQRASGAGIWDWDIATGAFSWDPSLYTIFGLDPAKDHPGFESWERIIHPGDRLVARERIEEALEQHTDLDNDYRIVLADGKVRWINALGRGIYDEEGHPVRMVGTCVDVTNRKEAENALRESRERLNEALDLLDAVTKGTDVIIAAQDPEFKYTYFNRAYADEIRRLTGRDIAVGMSVFEVFADLPGELENSVREWGRVLGGESVNRRVDFGEPGPSRRTYHVLHTPIRDFTGAVVGAGEVAYDVTDQARIEDELRQTRTYLENLINYANAPIIVWDPELRITRFNQAFEHLTGRKAEDVIGRDVSILFPEETKVESLEKILRTFAGERFETTEIPILHREGSVKTVLWNSATIFDEAGLVVATIAQGQDITDRKAAELALKQYAINLKRSNEDLERFAYVSSHDLQEPLRNVVIFTQLLERKYGGQMGEEADEYLRFVVDAGKRMQSLIRDLLEYSRVTTRAGNMARTESEAVLQETLESLRPRMDRCSAVITTGPLPPVMADPTQLGQVFQNLIGNAIKFRRHDERPEIHVAAHRLDGMVRFSVRDNGIGIDPEYFDKIFVIFQRLHRYEEYEGTGIGLALCKRIIERHGGQIWVESGVGKGSTFFFTLPAAD